MTYESESECATHYTTAPHKGGKYTCILSDSRRTSSRTTCDTNMWIENNNDDNNNNNKIRIETPFYKLYKQIAATGRPSGRNSYNITVSSNGFLILLQLSQLYWATWQYYGYCEPVC